MSVMSHMLVDACSTSMCESSNLLNTTCASPVPFACLLSLQKSEISPEKNTIYQTKGHYILRRELFHYTSMSLPTPPSHTLTVSTDTKESAKNIGMMPPHDSIGRPYLWCAHMQTRVCACVKFCMGVREKFRIRAKVSKCARASRPRGDERKRGEEGLRGRGQNSSKYCDEHSGHSAVYRVRLHQQCRGALDQSKSRKTSAARPRAAPPCRAAALNLLNYHAKLLQVHTKTRSSDRHPIG